MTGEEEQSVVFTFGRTRDNTPVALFGECTLCNGPGLSLLVFINGEWLGAGLCVHCAPKYLTSEAIARYSEDNDIVRMAFDFEGKTPDTEERMREMGMIE